MKNTQEIHDLEELLHDSSIRIIGVIADKNQGKSNVLYNIINIAKAKAPDTQIVGFKLSIYVPGIIMINSLVELSKVSNSLIILDEWADLVDTMNRKDMKSFEALLRTIYHPYRNNTIIMCGLARNFNGKISGELEAVIFKQTTVIDIVQRSRIDNILKSFRSEGHAIKNDYMLVCPKNGALIYRPGEPKDFHYIEIPYLPEYDVKSNNEPVIKWSDDTRLSRRLETLV